MSVCVSACVRIISVYVCVFVSRSFDGLLARFLIGWLLVCFVGQFSTAKKPKEIKHCGVCVFSRAAEMSY